MKLMPELLVVDDNPADVALVCEALAGGARHTKISSVGDGVEAMAFLNRREKYANALQPDLVILDLNLPKKDGLAVLAAMKAGPDLRRIPVVIFSTSQTLGDIERCYELGANSYVSKPATLRDWIAAAKLVNDFWIGCACLPQEEEQ